MAVRIIFSKRHKALARNKKFVIIRDSANSIMICLWRFRVEVVWRYQA